MQADELITRIAGLTDERDRLVSSVDPSLQERIRTVYDKEIGDLEHQLSELGDPVAMPQDPGSELAAADAAGAAGGEKPEPEDDGALADEGAGDDADELPDDEAEGSDAPDEELVSDETEDDDEPNADVADDEESDREDLAGDEEGTPLDADPDGDAVEGGTMGIFDSIPGFVPDGKTATTADEDEEVEGADEDADEGDKGDDDAEEGGDSDERAVAAIPDDEEGTPPAQPAKAKTPGVAPGSSGSGMKAPASSPQSKASPSTAQSPRVQVKAVRAPREQRAEELHATVVEPTIQPDRVVRVRPVRIKPVRAS